MTALLRTVPLIFAACLAYGQDKSLTFEVASVKPATPPVPNGRGMIMFRGPSGGPGTKDPGRINYPFMSLKSLLTMAYDVKNYQIDGPAWLDTERFDVTATMPPDTTKEQLKIMLQNLLAERFGLKLHHDTKELPMYSLVVGKNGPKMKESVETPPPAEGADATPAPPPPLPSLPKIGPDGFPILPAPAGGRGGIMQMMMPGRARMMGTKQTMQDLAQRLSQQLNRPVIDATGLTAKYDFTLTYAPEGMGGMGPVMLGAPPPPPPAGGAAGPGPGMPETDAPPPPNLFSAIQSDLGLRLEAKKGPVDMIVIDHVEKTPIEN